MSRSPTCSRHSPPARPLLVFLLACITVPSAASPLALGPLGSGLETSGQGGPDTPSACEPITVPICSDLPYNRTKFPNMLGHESQNEAALVVHQFYPLVKVECSRFLKMFLCSVYVPVCTIMDIPVRPCRQLCSHSRAGCEPLMNKFGFDWPEHLDCAHFPETGLCIDVAPGSDDVTETVPTLNPDVTYTISLSDMDLQGPWPNNSWHGETENVTYSDVRDECHPIETPLCWDILPYNQTEMPNIFNHIDQWEATLTIHEWRPLFQSGCSSYLRYLLCRALFPPCWDTEEADVIPTELPCRSMCHVVQHRCAHVMKSLHFDWPEEIPCDVFPVFGCLESENVEEGGGSIGIPTDSTVDGTCQQFSHPDCPGLTYDRTRLPNVFGHTTQGEIDLTLSRLKPLFSANCQSNLREVVCTNLFPPCKGGNEGSHGTVTSFCEDVVEMCQPFLEMGGKMPSTDICYFVHVSEACTSHSGQFMILNVSLLLALQYLLRAL